MSTRRAAQPEKPHVRWWQEYLADSPTRPPSCPLMPATPMRLAHVTHDSTIDLAQVWAARPTALPSEIAGIDRHGRVRVIARRHRGEFIVQIVGTRTTRRARSFLHVQRIAAAFESVEIRTRQRIA